jgi:hypothetical protein
VIIGCNPAGSKHLSKQLIGDIKADVVRMIPSLDIGDERQSDVAIMDHRESEESSTAFRSVTDSTRLSEAGTCESRAGVRPQSLTFDIIEEIPSVNFHDADAADDRATKTSKKYAKGSGLTSASKPAVHNQVVPVRKQAFVDDQYENQLSHNRSQSGTRE